MLTPIVLHHGILGFPNLKVGPVRLKYYRRVDRVLSKLGHPVIVTRVHPTAGIETRARQLKEIILRHLSFLGHRRTVVIAHSMGGLDARYMISRLGMEDHVSALLTITTPHRGSAFADWCVQHLDRLGGLRFARSLKLDVAAVDDLTTERCEAFNQEVIDSPMVRYFSVSASRPWRRVPPFALPSHKIVSKAQGENDGLVAVKSAIWGTHLGTWPADHWHTINHRLVLELKDKTGDITPYYLDALEKMERMGVLMREPVSPIAIPA
jgi:triacylglycerol lipase